MVRQTHEYQVMQSNNKVEPNEPAFLRRLKSEYQGGDPARHERPPARPRKHVREGEDDDQPTYVLEGSQNTLSKAEYEALMGVSRDCKLEGTEAASSPQLVHVDDKRVGTKTEISDDTGTANQKTASIGCLNKRRLAKIIAEDDDRPESIADEDSTQIIKKPKVKKAKKVKLSFDEEAPDL